jgi:hypothetical protein
MCAVFHHHLHLIATTTAISTNATSLRRIIFNHHSFSVVIKLHTQFLLHARKRYRRCIVFGLKVGHPAVKNGTPIRCFDINTDAS